MSWNAGAGVMQLTPSTAGRLADVLMSTVRFVLLPSLSVVQTNQPACSATSPQAHFFISPFPH